MFAIFSSIGEPVTHSVSDTSFDFRALQSCGRQCDNDKDYDNDNDNNDYNDYSHYNDYNHYNHYNHSNHFNHYNHYRDSNSDSEN